MNDRREHVYTQFFIVEAMKRTLAVMMVLLLVLSGCLGFGEAEEETVEESTCLVGTQKVLNASAANGFDCVPLDPHSMFHTHPAPELSVSNVIDDGSTIAILGDVDHLHPDEITVTLSIEEDVSISTQPNTDGAWSLTIQSSAERIYLNITATHDDEETISNTTFIEINRTTSEDEADENDSGTDDGTDNTNGNETGKIGRAHV